MKVTTHADRCIASGACVLASPHVFDQDDDGFVVLLTDDPDAADQESVREAARACPAMVIEVE
jgi:ferredoxin